MGALMAVHGLPPTIHNKQLQFQYRWAGNPFISNNYFRTLGSKPQYNLGSGLELGQPLKQERAGILLGDALGRPLRREIQGDFCLPSMRNWWNTSIRQENQRLDRGRVPQCNNQPRVRSPNRRT